MTIKTIFSENDFKTILLNYNIGNLIRFSPLEEGTVQTNYQLKTEKGFYVIRYYENRTKESTQFEMDLIMYLIRNHYPTPAPIKNKIGKFIGIYNNKPYVIFEYIQGKTLYNPSTKQKQHLIHLMAKLHNLTQNFSSSYIQYRDHYTISFCDIMSKKISDNINTQNAYKKLSWYQEELNSLILPKSLPKGICHCDFNDTNIIENHEKLTLIDFDHANHTYLLMDLVYLVEPFTKDFTWNTWQNYSLTDWVFDFTPLNNILIEYEKERKLTQSEKEHLFDIYKLSILIDCLWYFERGNADDFFEKRKIDSLNLLGRDKFYDYIFRNKKKI